MIVWPLYFATVKAKALLAIPQWQHPTRRPNLYTHPYTPEKIKEMTRNTSQPSEKPVEMR
jgi:hypothetical protein